MGPLFSIVMPIYNAAVELDAAIASVLAQTIEFTNFELVLVDDCSTDNSGEILARYVNHPVCRVQKTPSNGGPGVARNYGISVAQGDWIIFLDSDDRLTPDALHCLRDAIVLAEGEGRAIDAVGYNWCFREDGPMPEYGMRRDHVFLSDRSELLKRYLALQMDGSVIFTAIRRSLLSDYKISFAGGVHEDVDYLFQIYWHARAVFYVDRILYCKEQRQGSIVNTISVRHIRGYIRAWREIGLFLAGRKLQGWQSDYQRGLIALIATRLREIQRLSSQESAAEIYETLYLGVCDLLAELGLTINLALQTKYGRLAAGFWRIMSSFSDNKAALVWKDVAEIQNQSWSCIDLHHSVFLAPDQIRTCCKRFFVDGEIRGDVVLFDVASPRSVTSQAIWQAKQNLYVAINRGDSTACDGCPFLEFKSWPPLSPPDVHYLSMEYHSVCNLQCSYCSETYFGGKRAGYDVSALVDCLIESGHLCNCNTVVWGGGEPVVGDGFTQLIERLVRDVSGATHRVLTNAVKYSPVVARLLMENKVVITTSIDAGTAEIFKTVRGRDKFSTVLANLKKYAQLKPRRVTVKYIFTEENSTISEVRAFVEEINNYDLKDCSFQISSNFKEVAINLDAAVLMIAMYGLLRAAECPVVFFDDLLRLRLREIHACHGARMQEQLSQFELAMVLAQPEDYPQMVIWGAGLQAKYLLEDSLFFQRAKVICFVDNTAEKVGSNYLGCPVYSPEFLRVNSLPVLIAAVQGYPIIYDAYVRMGLDPARLVRGLIL